VAGDVALDGGSDLSLVGPARPDPHKVSERANHKGGNNRDGSNRTIHVSLLVRQQATDGTGYRKLGFL
jgi:hypothetical protein